MQSELEGEERKEPQETPKQTPVINRLIATEHPGPALREVLRGSARGEA